MDPVINLLPVILLLNQQVAQVVQLNRIRAQRRRRRRRRWWVRPWIGRRIELGIYDRLMMELRNEDTDSFTNFMRMPVPMFDELLERLRPRLTKKSTNFRQPLDPGLKLALTIRHLASGAKYKTMQYGWRVPHNTISYVVREVCQAIVDEYLEEMLTMPSTEDGWRAQAQDWYERWNFPHCLGAIDGKHVACKAPPNTGSEYYNYKGFFSVILFAMVSSDYKFLYADVSANGSSSDANIFNNSLLKQALEHDDLVGLPPPCPLPNDTEDVPFFIVGDDAFALRKYLMKPYSHRNLTHAERIFNYRLSRARRVVENAFGILVNRFQILMTTMQHHAETVRLLLKACIILHNIMRTRYPTMQNALVDRQAPNGDIIPGEWRQGFNMADTQATGVQGTNRASKEGKAQRNLLRNWCNSPAGSVPWQERMVEFH